MKRAPVRRARPSIHWLLAMLLGCAWQPQAPAGADTVPDERDSRIRTVIYSADAVYRLRGYVGYQIDLEFESDERFVGLGAGDVEGVAFAAQDNHLFLKPRAAPVRTNLTVLTTRRTYHFDYVTAGGSPESEQQEAFYALRFAYPPAADAAAELMAKQLRDAASQRARNLDYWYCGPASLRPLSAWDDGVHTHLQFNPRTELPALFVRNEDGSESLLNFNLDSGVVVVHRVARRLVVRRGRLSGCIVNKSFEGAGEELPSGTLAPDVERRTRGAGQ